MAETLNARIAHALSQVRNPRTGQDVYSSESVRDLATTNTGKVRMTLVLTPGDDPALGRAVRDAVSRVPGVADIQIEVVDAAAVEAKKKSRTLPIMDTKAPAAPAGRSAPQTPIAFPNLGKIIAISSGKGGVGKSTVAVNVAVALAQSGARVGLMDADVYGPNVPRMMGVNSSPSVINEQIVPLEAHGVKVISLGFLIDREQPAIWRGPIVMKIVNQFLKDVAWGTLDFLIVDMPPGTGDAQLSLVQAAHLAGAVIVTTPQEVSIGDALRGVKMFERVEVPVFGIVENMSWFECLQCGKPSPLFGAGGGAKLAAEVELPLLAQVPFSSSMVQGGDEGTPLVVSHPESSAAKALVALAARIASS